MKKIGLLSDTHSYLDNAVERYFAEVDEIWHAGDIGSIEVLEQLEAFKPTRAVYGNIDNAQIRAATKGVLRFELDGVDVAITHIAGYPGKYNHKVQEYLRLGPPKLFICGHSHILKVQFDKQHQMLHINPGAFGIHGFHKQRTMVRFELNQGKIENLEAIDLGARTKKLA